MQPRVDQLVAVVMAGGFGTRIRHLLPDVPKPMAPVAGRPFLEWVLRYLAKQGIGKAVLATGYLSEVIEQHFAPQPVAGLIARCVIESEPLGTGGGFLNAARGSGEHPMAWLVLNGDSLVLADITPALNLLADSSTAGVIVGCSVADAARYGTLAIGPTGELLGFHEKRSGQGVINAGVYLLRDDLVRELPAGRPLSFEKEIFPQCIERGLGLKVAAVVAPFLDIGTPESLAQAEAFIRQNEGSFA